MSAPRPFLERKRRSMPVLLAKKAAVALAMLVALASCGGGGDADDSEDAGRSTTTADEATTSAAPEETTTTVAAEGPAEWVDAMRNIEERRLALAQDPDPDAIATLYSEDCSCWAAETDPIRELADLDHHLEGEPRTVLAVWHWGTDEFGFSDITVQLLAHPLRELDAQGTVFQEFPASGDPICFAYTVQPDGPEGSYRVHELTRLQACPEGGG